MIREHFYTMFLRGSLQEKMYKMLTSESSSILSILGGCLIKTFQSNESWLHLVADFGAFSTASSYRQGRTCWRRSENWAKQRVAQPWEWLNWRSKVEWDMRLNCCQSKKQNHVTCLSIDTATSFLFCTWVWRHIVSKLHLLLRLWMTWMPAISSLHPCSASARVELWIHIRIELACNVTCKIFVTHVQYIPCVTAVYFEGIKSIWRPTPYFLGPSCFVMPRNRRLCEHRQSLTESWWCQRDRALAVRLTRMTPDPGNMQTVLMSMLFRQCRMSDLSCDGNKSLLLIQRS